MNTQAATVRFNLDNITYKFRPYFKNKDRYLLLWGGRDSGKSYFAAQKLIFECLELPYFRCILVKKTYESIKDSQWQTLKDLIYQYNLDEYFTFNKSPLEIECFNGNKFIARGCDKPEKLKSIKDPSHVWYEEGNHLSYEDFITITTTLRSTDAEYLQEILSFNPELENDPEDFWIYKEFFEGNEGKSFSSNYKITIDNVDYCYNYSVLHSTYRDNPFCTPERKGRLEKLKTTSPYWYTVYTLGEWGVKEVKSPYMSSFDDKLNVSTSAVFDHKQSFRISFDFNVDNCAAVFSHAGYDYIHFFDEMIGNNLPDLLEKIKRKYNKYLFNCLITGDRSGSSRHHLMSDNTNSYRMIKNTLKLKDRQFKILNNPTHQENRFTCNSILAYHPNVFFHPVYCKETIYDMKYVECDQQERIIKKDRNIANQKADLLDAARYTFNTFHASFVKKYKVSA